MVARSNNRCVRCSGPKRGRSGRQSDIVQMCARCDGGVCTRHVTWDSSISRWVCVKCYRKAHEGKEVA